jgi:hypothetical protein
MNTHVISHTNQPNAIEPISNSLASIKLRENTHVTIHLIVV